MDDYLGDMDLPSSESEGEEEIAPVREEKKDTIRMAQVKLPPALSAQQGFF